MLKRRRMQDKKAMVDDGYKLCKICGEPIIKLDGSRKELNSDEIHWACDLWAKTRNIYKIIRRKERENKKMSVPSQERNEIERTNGQRGRGCGVLMQ